MLPEQTCMVFIFLKHLLKYQGFKLILTRKELMIKKLQQNFSIDECINFKGWYITCVSIICAIFNLKNYLVK